jgi:outer membrane lipoprotein-sorting protein
MKTYLALLLLLLLSACTQKDLNQSNATELFHQQVMSKDYHYLLFNDINKPYHLVAAVGGEQMNIQKIWAFKGQKYQISVIPIKEKATLYVNGEGLAIQQETATTVNQFSVEVLADDAIIEVSQTAHPEPANYKLSIIRLK